MNLSTNTTNKTLLNLLYACMLATCLSACSGSGKKETTGLDSTTTVTSGTTATAAPEASATTTPASGSTEVFSDFDWSTVPISTAQIGAFPYLTAPAGMYIGEKDSYSESKTGYSSFADFNKLIMFTGTSFYNAEGKVAKLKFRVKDNADWNQYKFDSSVEKYLTSIGAKLIGKMQVNEARKAFLNKDDEMAIYNHIVGDPYNLPVRFYALNHTKGKIMFQVFSNTATADVGVVELTGFEQTIKAPTAAQMKKDIDATGKAILNINFDTDKSTLQPEGQKAVDEILALLKNDASLKIAI